VVIQNVSRRNGMTKQNSISAKNYNFCATHFWKPGKLQLSAYQL
jgi:hypothetical protein